MSMIESILVILLASACTFFLALPFINIKKINFENENEVWGLSLFTFLFLLSTSLISCWGASMHGWAIQLAGTIGLTVPACVVAWMCENRDKANSIVESLYGHFFQRVNHIANFANGIWQNIAKNDTFVRRYARKRVSQLCDLMPGLEWSNMRDQIASVGITALASLLARRKLLKANISATAHIIKKYGGNLSSDVMHQLHTGTLVDIETFQQELAKTEMQVGDIIGFLDEVESDVRMALISDDGHAELDKQLLQFAASIQSVKADERAVQQELRSYLGHSSKAVSEDSDTVSQAHSHIQRALE